MNSDNVIAHIDYNAMWAKIAADDGLLLNSHDIVLVNGGNDFSYWLVTINDIDIGGEG